MTKVNKLDEKITDATTLIQINQQNTEKQYLEKNIEDVDKKKTDFSGAVTTTVLNTKIKEVENKVLILVVQPRKQIMKLSEIEGEQITTFDYNKFTSDIADARIKQKELFNKSDISNVLKSSDVNI